MNDAPSSTANDDVQLQSIKDTLARLRSSLQYEQRSPAWYDVRKTLVTASDASAILRRTTPICKQYIETFSLPQSFADGKGCNPYCSEREYTLRKHGRSKDFGNGSVATQWGNRFEDVACGIYKRLMQTDVEMFGLLVHPGLEWLAASPDGVTSEGILLEIKCPYRRKLTGITLFHYWIQVQIQLEVLDLPAADFFEVEFTEYRSREQFLADAIDSEEREEKGVYVKTDKVTSICPPVAMTDPIELLEWADGVVKANETWVVVYWKMVYYENTRIHRSKEWFESVKGKLYQVHTRVQNMDPETLPNHNVPKEVTNSLKIEPRRKRPRPIEAAIVVDICGGTSD